MKYKIINRKKLLLTRIFDAVGGILSLPFRIFRAAGEITPRSVKRILIIRTAYIGDIVMTLPVLKPLKERFPDAEISFLSSVAGADVLYGNPYIDKIYKFDPFWFYKSPVSEYPRFLRLMRKERFDLIIEARGDIRDILFLVSPLKAKFKLSYAFGGGAYMLTHHVPFEKMKHRVEYHLDMVRFIGCDTDRLDWDIYLTGQERERVKDMLVSNGLTGPFIAVHPGSRIPLKKLSPEKYAAVCDALIERYDMPLVILGAGSEIEDVTAIAAKMNQQPVVLAGKTTLRETAGIIEISKLFICNDSAPMHIAAAMKTPTVAVFGPSKSIETSPYGNLHAVVEKDFPCRYTCDESVCLNADFHACMKEIKADDIIEAADRVITYGHAGSAPT